MQSLTGELWGKQDRHEGDRQRLFSAVAGAVDAATVLYPGSYVDIAASMAFWDVTYIDSDDRAARFFADAAGVRDIVATQAPAREERRRIRFVHGDYRGELPDLVDGSFDLLVSLYAGFISEHCTRFLRVGGSLLVNSSHGDAAMASIDDRYRLAGVVKTGTGRYRIDRSALDTYLVPKKPQQITPDLLHRLGRGLAYTKSPFAYLFERVQ